MKKSVFTALLAVTVLFTIMSCALKTTNEPNLPVIGTEWKYIAGYTNNVLAYDAIYIGGGVTNYMVFTFHSDFGVQKNYSNDIIIGLSTNTDMYTSENWQMISNVSTYTTELVYGTLVYKMSPGPTSLRLYPYSFSGTNSSGVDMSTNFYNIGYYILFNKY